MRVLQRTEPIGHITMARHRPAPRCWTWQIPAAATRACNGEDSEAAIVNEIGVMRHRYSGNYPPDAMSHVGRPLKIGDFRAIKKVAWCSRLPRHPGKEDRYSRNTMFGPGGSQPSSNLCGSDRRIEIEKAAIFREKPPCKGQPTAYGRSVGGRARRRLDGSGFRQSLTG